MWLGVESRLNKLKSVPGVALFLESLVLVGIKEGGFLVLLNAWNCVDYLERDLYFGFLDQTEPHIFGNKLTRTSK